MKNTIVTNWVALLSFIFTVFSCSGNVCFADAGPEEEDTATSATVIRDAASGPLSLASFTQRTELTTLAATVSSDPVALPPKITKPNDELRDLVVQLFEAHEDGKIELIASIAMAIEDGLEKNPSLNKVHGRVLEYICKVHHVQLKRFTAADLAKGSPPLVKIPYFQQSDNTEYPGESGANSCLAMILRGFGWEGTPDDLTKEYGIELTRNPYGAALLFNRVAAKQLISVRGKVVEDSTKELRAALASAPVILFGNLKRSGNVVLVKSFRGRYYIVNDPIGCWDEEENTYDNSIRGENKRYPRDEFEKAILFKGKVRWIRFEAIR